MYVSISFIIIFNFLQESVHNINGIIEGSVDTTNEASSNTSEHYRRR